MVYPNRVNFKIVNEAGKQQVVHHNRLSPVKDVIEPETETSSDESEHEVPQGDEYGDEAGDDDVVNLGVRMGGRYPVRERRPRELPGTIPWNAIDL